MNVHDFLTRDCCLKGKLEPMDQALFRILDTDNPDDIKKWVEVWEHWPKREVHAHPDYVKLYLNGTSKGYCAIFESMKGNAMYPFICRDLTKESFGDIGVFPLCDIITPHGYGGPFVWGCDNPKELAVEFWANFNTWANERNVVSEVIKFSLFSENLLPYAGEKEEKLQNIIVDLELSEEELWMNFESKVRKNVKKAKRNGLNVILDSTGEKLDDFLAIYQSTLDRRGSENIYYFSRSFFDNIHKKLPRQFMYFHAIYQEKIVSSELVLVSHENIYSFLGGTYSDRFSLSPNDLLKYEIINWGRKQGKRRFVLGGGHEAGDGIYRYKKSFAPGGSVPFFIGCRILHRDLYDVLLQNKKRTDKLKGIEWVPKEGYIPEYRT